MSLDVSVKKRFKGFTLDVSFQSGGEFLGILGASGCGKSMTLKSIAGIETPDEGKIVAAGRTLFHSGKKINLKPQNRKVGYLFQHYALFPNMRVRENIACALGHLKKGKEAKITEMVRRFHLEGLEDRYPAQLSGGQQQRVALARILAYEPEVLLLDEPFSALDYFLREQLQAELLDYLGDYGGDIVMVTHSRDEVYRLSKKLMVLDNGSCVAFGDTKELFGNPRYLSVAKLTGCKNYSRAEKTGSHSVNALDWGVSLTLETPVDDDVDYIGVRAHNFRPATGTDPVPNRIPLYLRERLESQFEWNIVFSPRETDRLQRLWWMIPKNMYSGSLPEALSIDPKHILPLRSGGPSVGSSR